MNKKPVQLFSYKNVFALILGFIASVLLANAIVRFINEKVAAFDCPNAWPISIFWFRIPNLEQILISAAVLILFIILIKLFSKINYRIFYVFTAGIILVLATNLIGGWQGLINPVLGSGQVENEYYYDAIKIKDCFYFLSHFEQNQPDLLVHTRSHPPGAVLAVYFLLKILGNPGLASAAISVISSFLSMFFIYKILLKEFGENNLAKYAAFLFMLIPGIQIYYCATIDAIIAGLLLASLYYFVYSRTHASIIGSCVFIFFASFLTFGFLFILPVLAGYEILKRPSLV